MTLGTFKRYKAVVVDYDGTVASKQTGEISVGVKRAIQEVIDRGYVFSFVTGRSYFGRIQHVCKELGLTSPQVVAGGAEIREPQTDSLLWSKYIDSRALKGVISYLLENNIYFAIERDNYVFTPDGKNPFYNRACIFQSVHDVDSNGNAKILIPSFMNNFSDVQLENLLISIQRTFQQLFITKTAFRNSISLEITSAQANKGSALLAYFSLLGLTQSEVIGIGDSYNDIPLFAACGFTVAMGDAPLVLRDQADMVVGSESDSGFSSFVRSFLLS